MLSLPSRRALLRRYSEDALNILECADPNMKFFRKRFINVKDLNRKLRFNWIRRAALFFDSRSMFLPYINHIYTMDLRTPHTVGDVKQFVDRNTDNLWDRNPGASQSEIRRIFYIHPVVRDARYDVDEIFFDYGEGEMTKAEYYFEYHLNQFYRILFLFVELQAHGIVTDEDDIYNETIPYSKVPERIQAIVYNDTVYRQYLIDKREEELRLCKTDNSHRNNLKRASRVREVDLILLFWTRIRNQIKAAANLKTSTTTTVSITTTIATTSTSPGYFKSKKEKGIIIRGASGKCFLKKQETFSDESYENPGSSSSKTSSNIQQRLIANNNTYYGYILKSKNNRQTFSSSNVLKLFFESLQSSK